MIVVSLGFLFEILSIVFCLHYLYGEKAGFDIWTISFVLFDVVWLSIVEFFSLGQSWSLLMYPIAILYSGIKFGYNPKAIIINNILYMAILSGIQTTIMVLFYVCLDIERSKGINTLMINVILFGAVIFGLRKIELKKLSDVLQSNEKIVMLSLIVVVISTGLFLATYKQNRGFEELYYVVLSVSIILIAIAAVDIGKHKIKAKEAEAELRLHKLYEEPFRNLIDEICARQHEFDNHINTIYSQHFLYKTYEELVEAQKKYCSEVTKENRFNKLLTKGNPVILCFLYSRFTEAEKEGVTVSYRINIGNMECSVPTYKIVELLGNLIKNAVEAVKEREDGSIHVMMLEEKDRIRIEVSNESEVVDYQRIQEFFRKGYSEKGKNRGYGLYNVKKICGDYGIGITCENREENGRNRLVFGLTINKPL